MQVRDSLALDASGLTLTKDGFLVGNARVSRAGNVQSYYGHELGLKDGRANKIFGVYRDPDVVFDESSMMSLAGRPVTRNHPDEMVTADNWKDLSVGHLGGTIKRDGEHVVAPMVIMDRASAAEVADGARSLSAGYTVEIVAGDGVAPDGTPYQFRQASPLRFNHVAYLPDNNPRGGNTRIGDAVSTWDHSPLRVEDSGRLDDQRNTAPQPNGVRPMALKTIMLDGLPIETTDAGELGIIKLKGMLDTAATVLTTTVAAKDAEIAAKDAELATKDARITALEGQVLDSAAMDAAVAARADLISKAKALAPTFDAKGKTDLEIKTAAVRAKLGDAAVTDKSEAYIDAAFDIQAQGVKPVNSLGAALAHAVTDTGDANQEQVAYDHSIHQLNDWRNPPAAAKH